MTRIIQGDLCLEKAYKAIFQKFVEKIQQQFKFLEVRAMLLALKKREFQTVIVLSGILSTFGSYDYSVLVCPKDYQGLDVH